VAAAGQEAARDPDRNIDRVRMLYVSAAYEEALAAMPPVGGGAVRTDLEQYRALCLLALGREQEAVATVERLVNDNPLFVPPAAETSPRMQSMFVAARSKVVPLLAQRQYAAAKTAYGANDPIAARAGFRRTLDLIGSLPDPDKAAKLADLRLLATEFLDLSAARSVPSPDLTPPTAGAVSTPDPRAQNVTLPIVIREHLPAWNPPNGEAKRTTYVGVLRVFVGADGRVERATIVKPSHPTYDAAALRAARQWTYRPATRGGTPVPAQRDIQVRLVPR
jgi:TonB family protein